MLEYVRHVKIAIFQYFINVYADLALYLQAKFYLRGIFSYIQANI